METRPAGTGTSRSGWLWWCSLERSRDTNATCSRKGELLPQAIFAPVGIIVGLVLLRAGMIGDVKDEVLRLKRRKLC